MNLSKILGLEIVEVKYSYVHDNQYSLQEFSSYFKLSNNLIFKIPFSPHDEYDFSDEIIKKYEKLKKVSFTFFERIKNKKITDFHFLYFENEIEELDKCYMELEDGLYIYEKSFGPIGITNVDLNILDEIEFNKLKQNLDEDFALKSFVTEIKK